ncbi:unnamed protein product [Camellia sinensis]
MTISFSTVFATLLHECLNLIKKGSAKEIALAAHAIGLLALTTEIVRVTKLGRQEGEDTISEQAANVFADWCLQKERYQTI